MRSTNKFLLNLFLVGLLMSPINLAQAKEQLFVPINNTWKAVQSKEGKGAKEFIPTAEQEQNWSKRVTIKEMPGNKLSSDKYADEMQAEIEKSGQCTKFVTAEPIEKKGKGFEESVITFQCLQKDGSSKIFMSKSIESPLGLYEVRYSFVTDSKGMFNGKSLKNYLWEDVVEFMQLVTLCDDSVKDRACPLMK